MARITLFDAKGEQCTADWLRHTGQWYDIYKGSLEECLKFIEENEHYLGLKSFDSLHVASVEYLKADIFLTIDKNLLHNKTVKIRHQNSKSVKLVYDMDENELHSKRFRHYTQDWH